MTLLASLIDQAERMIPQHVLEAREHGHSWHDIALALVRQPHFALWPAVSGRLRGLAG
jgi:hypothetical protein